jgi:hypothetical protein
MYAITPLSPFARHRRFHVADAEAVLAALLDMRDEVGDDELDCWHVVEEYPTAGVVDETSARNWLREHEFMEDAR